MRPGLNRARPCAQFAVAPTVVSLQSRLPLRVVERLLASAESNTPNGGHHSPYSMKEVCMEKALPLNDADFVKEVTESTTPVLVDFWATWCGPCQMMGPIVEGLAEEYAGKVKVMKMNVDANPMTPAKFGIRGIPTLLLFQKGEVVDRIVGAVPKGTVENSLKKVLG